MELKLNRDQIIAQNPILPYLRSLGLDLRKSGHNYIANRCPRLTHRRDHFPLEVYPHTESWNCHDCQIGGSVIDWLVHANGCAAIEAMVELSRRSQGTNASRRYLSTSPQTPKSPELVAAYDYTDDQGNLLYQQLRYFPKDFRSRRPDGKGGWIANLDGVTRVLFNLPKILISADVIVTEGEKDVLTLGNLGFVATTNCGGAKNWLPAYWQYLEDKDVTVIPDNDPDGEHYLQSILRSQEGALSLKVLRLPRPFKDITDFVQSFPTKEEAKAKLKVLLDNAAYILPPLEILNMAELEEHYRKHLQESASRLLDLSGLSIGLSNHIGQLVPGEMALVIADTGVGKTALLQNIARAAGPLPTLFFELELPASLMYERFVQMEVGCKAEDVQRDTKSTSGLLSPSLQKLQHVYVCPESGLTVSQIERRIVKSQLKIGSMPAVVLVDYVGLLKREGGFSRKRYEAISDAAEEFKVMARRTNTIVIIAAQIGRESAKKKERKDGTINLHDAKDSGSLESSAGLVLGCWRPKPDELVVKVLKNTKGTAGHLIKLHFNGATMQITEPRPNGQP
jgi:hypothetical protein